MGVSIRVPIKGLMRVETQANRPSVSQRVESKLMPFFGLECRRSLGFDMNGDADGQKFSCISSVLSVNASIRDLKGRAELGLRCSIR
jgi:hypothetical protein